MKVTLRSLRDRFSHLFYPQTWFLSEPFMDRPVESMAGEIVQFPRGIEQVRNVANIEDTNHHLLHPAAELAQLYIMRPTLPVWKNYIWCEDVDSQNQRIYIGDNGKGLEIHRHIHITERFGVPVW